MAYEYRSTAGTVLLVQTKDRWLLHFAGRRSGRWPSPDEAARAVARHQSGLAVWDRRRIEAPYWTGDRSANRCSGAENHYVATLWGPPQPAARGGDMESPTLPRPRPRDRTGAKSSPRALPESRVRFATAGATRPDRGTAREEPDRQRSEATSGAGRLHQSSAPGRQRAPQRRTTLRCNTIGRIACTGLKLRPGMILQLGPRQSLLRPFPSVFAGRGRGSEERGLRKIHCIQGSRHPTTCRNSCGIPPQSTAGC